MAKGKTGSKQTKTASKPARTASAAPSTDIGNWDAPEFEGEFTDASLSWEDRQLLGTTVRFLFTIVDGRYLRRAIRAGYTKEEHAELWQLLDRAAGRDKPLDMLSGEGTNDPERQRLLVEIDEFENQWFPRADKIIRRFVPEDSVEAFLAAFFKDLKQQPLGPAVLDSTSTFLSRVDQLATSKLPGAAQVLAQLRARTLTEGKAREIRDKIESLRKGLVKARPVDAATAAAAAADQAAAVQQLRLAWADWSTTLRPLYDIREQVQLGLTAARNTRAAAELNAEPAPTDPAAPGDDPDDKGKGVQ